MVLSPFIFVNLTSAVCCFIFLLFLIITYFSKKNMDNLENKVYRYMLISNMLTVFFYSCYYIFDIIAGTSENPNTLYPIVYVLSKLAPTFVIAWCGFLVIYLIIIINEKNEAYIEKLKNNEKRNNIIVVCLIIFILILNLFENKKINLATGVEEQILLVTNISLYALFTTIFVLILKNKKKLPKKKVIPVFMIIPLTTLALVIGIVGVPIVFPFLIATIIDHIMYHTIENPDMKMIAQLQLAKDQAEKSNKAKSDFLSSMSHEIRTPLNAIVGLSQVIAEGDDMEAMRNDSRDVIVASQNLLEIVNGILDINKLETNQMEVIESLYNPQELFNSVLKMINIRIGEKPLELKTYYSDNLPQALYGDKDKIKQIITNLLTNAVKYTDKGFIYFNVLCKVDRDKCALTISVKDTGRGIDDEQKTKLFTKFNRLESDKDSDIQGTGLGLAITKSLVELLDGSITVDSFYGQGSTFTVNIIQKIVSSTDSEIL